MSARRGFRALALCMALVTTSAATVSCAYILHPERRNSGRTSGNLDTRSLVFDILWFLPGIIPGVIALIVDFTTGAIYVRVIGDDPINASGKVAVKVPPVGGLTNMSLRLLTTDGRVLHEDSAMVRPEDPERKLTVDVERGRLMARALGASDQRMQLELRGQGEALLSVPLATHQ